MIYKDFYLDLVGNNVHIMRNAEIICIAASIEDAKNLVDNYLK